MANSTDIRSFAIVFRVEDWTSSQRRQFMDTFSENMEQLAPTLWTGTLVRIPKGDAYRIEDNPGDDPMFRLSFAPGYDGSPLRVSVRLNIPDAVHQIMREKAKESIKGLEDKAKDDWMLKYAMPALGWLFRIPKEERVPAKILEDVVAKESQRLEGNISEASSHFWMQHASAPLISMLLLSTYNTLRNMNLDKPVPQILLEGNGQTIEVGLEDLTAKPLASGRTATLKA